MYAYSKITALNRLGIKKVLVNEIKERFNCC